nr:ribonuclease H-like domain-containing protein [Tanacetum cinerariifolium]
MNCHVTTTSTLPHSHIHALRDPNWQKAMLDGYNALSTNGTYKARLVANGRSQQQGIDHDETFSPVVKPTTIRTVLSLAISRDWPIHQLDVKNAFLYGQLSETVYMHQPLGFVDPHHPDYVCHLQRSLYGLKQAPHAWFQRFASFVTRIGFQHSKIDTSLFIFYRGSNIAYRLLYVDDIILTASSTTLAGALQCLSFTRPDLSYAVQQLHVSSTTQLTAYTDADWAGCLVTRQSTTGYYVFFSDNLLSWSAKRQVTLSSSSAESEYRGVANVVAETAWIRNLLCELHTLLVIAPLVYYDNVSAVYMSANLVQHQHTKHIEIDIHFVCDVVAKGEVHVLHMPLRFQYADIFTKGLHAALFIEFRSSLNVRGTLVSTEEEY